MAYSDVATTEFSVLLSAIKSGAKSLPLSLSKHMQARNALGPNAR
jgi:hypothetical protein